MLKSCWSGDKKVAWLCPKNMGMLLPTRNKDFIDAYEPPIFFLIKTSLSSRFWWDSHDKRPIGITFPTFKPRTLRDHLQTSKTIQARKKHSQKQENLQWVFNATSTHPFKKKKSCAKNSLLQLDSLKPPNNQFVLIFLGTITSPLFETAPFESIKFSELPVERWDMWATIPCEATGGFFQCHPFFLLPFLP